MIRSLYAASTGMFAQQINMDNIAQNISNVNTTGFKKTRVVFQDLLYSRLPAPRMGDQGTTLELGSGVRVAATVRDFTDGSVIYSGQMLDVALGGNGFLAVQDPDRGVVYTRAGNLRLTDGKVTTVTGQAVLDVQGREISVGSDNTDIEIDEKGRITGIQSGSEDRRELGQVGVALINDVQAMQALGANLYRSEETLNIGVPGKDNRAILMPGFIETANVQVIEEMVNLITAQRAYEVGSKAIQASDEMLQLANNLRR